VLLARSDDGFALDLVLRAPEPRTARDELERLAGLQGNWRTRGWPVPPETGWSLVIGERRRPGQGRSRAAETWEGSAFLDGERCRAEMVACFGADLPAEALLTQDVESLADQLLAPVLAAEVEP
jgi:exodeoxyribonuclease V gamma subunit